LIFLGELRVDAVHQNLRTISYFIHGIARRLRLTEKALFDIDLAIEEAVTNIINHAYSSEQVGEIMMRVELQDEVMQITLTDWGVPLDPESVRPFDLHAPVETRITGGMGLHLIYNLMDSVKRVVAPTLGEPNALILRKRIQRVQPGARRPSVTRELNAIRAISMTMATNIDLDTLLRLIVNKLVETIGAERGTLYLVDEERGEIVSRVLLEDTSVLEEIRVKIGEGISGHVAATGDILNIQNAYEDPRFLRAIDKKTGYRVRTLLTAPMVNPHQKIIGVVQLLNKIGEPFTSRDERLLTAMSAQAAISIENARLYAQEMEQQLINRELETARGIQQSFLPQAIPQHAGWDIAAFWHPVREVAGDFYDFYTLPDGRLAVVIADVSGKGVPAALFMALTTTVLRFAMSLNFAPDQLMDQANQAILSDQRSKMFATVFVGYVDLDSGAIRYASAGHNPPLLYRAATGRCEYLEALGVAMGVFKDADYAGETVRLADGDVLVMYTDGITEASRPDEEEFGEERLDELLRGCATCSAQEISDLIVQTVADFAQGQGTSDDETLVVIKRQGRKKGSGED
jgi:serine phosphatase RsbU (regulator of sigma subunit)/anti-sigma regulatory factor (Ser/Thr protein kinase)